MSMNAEGYLFGNELFALAPVADFVNHLAYPTIDNVPCKLEFTPHLKAHRIIACKNYKPNEQIFISYEKPNNFALLFSFGFVINQNPFDWISLQLKYLNHHFYTQLWYIFYDNIELFKIQKFDDIFKIDNNNLIKIELLALFRMFFYSQHVTNLIQTNQQIDPFEENFDQNIDKLVFEQLDKYVQLQLSSYTSTIEVYLKKKKIEIEIDIYNY
eukprot:TRINITY_DN1124_c1_g1_i2.p1 TRINITY_DN1124_c1_g1~~TRINITY_DN1124_c1_g1_i2.p1  ORF type:complete len:213 (+),score=74.01 TRINITY_DN1124_c1_g1_i2:403-1041(+)